MKSVGELPVSELSAVTVATAVGATLVTTMLSFSQPETVKAPELPPNANEEDVRKLAWEQMRACFDPEIPINIVDLGLVYACDVTQNDDGTRTVEVTITLTAPGCGMGEILVDDVRDKIQRIPTVREARVSLTFDPPWNQSMMSEAARLQTGMF